VPLRRQGIRVIIPRMEEPRRNEPGPRRPSRARGALIAVLGAGAIVLAVLAGSAFLPRWWSHRIADQAQGNFTAGISLGLFYGFVFTLLPLLVLRFAFRRRRSFRTWGIWVIVALVLALPNLVTLGIVLGTGNAAHAGERTLDVEAPGFRTSTLAGALLAVAGVLGLEYLLAGRRRSARRLASLEEELAAGRRDEEPAPAEPPS
jgi:hypothetical protein